MLSARARCSRVRCSSTCSGSTKLKCSVLVLATEHQMLEHCSSLAIIKVISLLWYTVRDNALNIVLNLNERKSRIIWYKVYSYYKTWDKNLIKSLFCFEYKLLKYDLNNGQINEWLLLFVLSLLWSKSWRKF